jgi:hypothetical protein
MALELNGTTGVSLVQDGVVTASDLASNAITSAALPTGSVLQVLSTTKTDTFSETVNTKAISGDVTGLTVTITPSSANSNILVACHIVGAGTGQNGIVPVLYRNGSIVTGAVGDASGSRKRVSSVAIDVGTDGVAAAVTFSFLDSPSSTDAQTYSIRLRHYSGADRVVYVNRSVSDADSGSSHRFASTITAMEIAG